MSANNQKIALRPSSSHVSCIDRLSTELFNICSDNFSAVKNHWSDTERNKLQVIELFNVGQFQETDILLLPYHNECRLKTSLKILKPSNTERKIIFSVQSGSIPLPQSQLDKFEVIEQQFLLTTYTDYTLNGSFSVDRYAIDLRFRPSCLRLMDPALRQSAAHPAHLDAIIDPGTLYTVYTTFRAQDNGLLCVPPHYLYGHPHGLDEDRRESLIVDSVVSPKNFYSNSRDWGQSHDEGRECGPSTFDKLRFGKENERNFNDVKNRVSSMRPKISVEAIKKRRDSIVSIASKLKQPGQTPTSLEREELLRATEVMSGFMSSMVMRQDDPDLEKAGSNIKEACEGNEKSFYQFFTEEDLDWDDFGENYRSLGRQRSRHGTERAESGLGMSDVSAGWSKVYHSPQHDKKSSRSFPDTGPGHPDRTVSNLSLPIINTNRFSEDINMHFRGIRPEIMASTQLRPALHQQPLVRHVQPVHSQTYSQAVAAPPPIIAPMPSMYGHPQHGGQVNTEHLPPPGGHRAQPGLLPTPAAPPQAQANPPSQFGVNQVYCPPENVWPAIEQASHGGQQQQLQQQSLQQQQPHQQPPQQQAQPQPPLQPPQQNTNQAHQPRSHQDGPGANGARRSGPYRTPARGQSQSQSRGKAKSGRGRSGNGHETERSDKQKSSVPTRFFDKFASIGYDDDDNDYYSNDDYDHEYDDDPSGIDLDFTNETLSWFCRTMREEHRDEATRLWHCVSRANKALQYLYTREAQHKVLSPEEYKEIVGTNQSMLTNTVEEAQRGVEHLGTQFVTYIVNQAYALDNLLADIYHRVMRIPVKSAQKEYFVWAASVVANNQTRENETFLNMYPAEVIGVRHGQQPARATKLNSPGQTMTEAPDAETPASPSPGISGVASGPGSTSSGTSSPETATSATTTSSPGVSQTPPAPGLDLLEVVFGRKEETEQQEMLRYKQVTDELEPVKRQIRDLTISEAETHLANLLSTAPACESDRWARYKHNNLLGAIKDHIEALSACGFPTSQLMTKLDDQGRKNPALTTGYTPSPVTFRDPGMQAGFTPSPGSTSGSSGGSCPGPNTDSETSDTGNHVARVSAMDGITPIANPGQYVPGEIMADAINDIEAALLPPEQLLEDGPLDAEAEGQNEDGNDNILQIAA